MHCFRFLVLLMDGPAQAKNSRKDLQLQNSEAICIQSSKYFRKSCTNAASIFPIHAGYFHHLSDHLPFFAVRGSCTIVLFIAGALHKASPETLFMTQKKIVGSNGLIKRPVSQGLDRHPKNPGRSRPYASNLFHRAQIAG